jgi:hypothetical protein
MGLGRVYRLDWEIWIRNKKMIGVLGTYARQPSLGQGQGARDFGQLFKEINKLRKN